MDNNANTVEVIHSAIARSTVGRVTVYRGERLVVAEGAEGALEGEIACWLPSGQLVYPRVAVVR